MQAFGRMLAKCEGSKNPNLMAPRSMIQSSQHQLEQDMIQIQQKLESTIQSQAQASTEIKEAQASFHMASDHIQQLVELWSKLEKDAGPDDGSDIDIVSELIKEIIQATQA